MGWEGGREGRREERREGGREGKDVGKWGQGDSQTGEVVLHRLMIIDSNFVSFNSKCLEERI